jgi:beta-lactam-binding protein with PASTA domain
MARPVPADLEDALAATPEARDRFWTLPPEQKDGWVAYVERSRFPGARRRRIAQTVRRLAGVPPARAVATNGVAADGAGPVALPRENWALWLVGLALLAALAAFLVWLAAFRHHDGGPKPAAVVVTAKTTVPKVTGIRYQSARFQLKEAKLTATLTRRNSSKPKGIVLKQTPADGKRVQQGTKVALVVSKGPAGVALPDLTGMAAGDAVQALRARKLVATVQQTPSHQAPGTVVAQTPKPGKRAKAGTHVTLQVAQAPAPVQVPDVTGQTQQAATAALQHAGLTAHVVQVASAQTSGTVLAQNPPAGTKLAKGAAVRVNVAKGRQAQTQTGQTQTAPTQTAPTQTAPTQTAPTQTAPTQTGPTQTGPTQTGPTQTGPTNAPATGNDYRGMRLAAAVQKIVQGRQQVIVQYVASSEPAGVVVSNGPAGAKERLQVSAGPHPKPGQSVPDTTGEDAATAQQDLQDAGFTVIQATWPVSDPSSDGVVVQQTPSAGGDAPSGTTIVVYVGSANGG